MAVKTKEVKHSQEVIRKLNDAWLNIDVDDKFVINPFERLLTDDPEEFYDKFTALLMNPDYFTFICKHLLNIELLPIQALILNEMWNRKFPMLIGTRGLGKAISVNELVLTYSGWVKMGDITHSHSIYGRDGNLYNVTGIYPQGKKQICRLKFSDGRSIDCCEDHLWVMKRQKREVVVSTKEIIENGFVHYKLPNCEPIAYEEKQLLVNPYILGCSADNKFIHEDYKTSSIEDRMELIRGLLDTFGLIDDEGSIEFSNTSEKLVDDTIDVLRSLGISCIKTDPYRISINTSKNVFKDPEKLKKLKSEQTDCEKYTSLISAEYTSEYVEMQCISVDSPDNTYIIKDHIVTHNTFILSLYCILRAALMPNRKIVVVGAAFRQSKFLHDYMETIWKNAPVLRDMCDGNSGPRRDVDMCKMTINGSMIVALPIGDGQKIRGQRANDIIADEFASMSREIFENVIAGFAAVSASPVDSVKLLAKQRMAEQMGIDYSTVSEGNKLSDVQGNQIVLSGTAYYDFNHFADYWKRWKTIIETKGDPRAISNNVFNGQPVPSSFNWKDYSIMRIPVDLVPRGFMDEGQIARSKATVHSGIYLMEFGAVFTKDSQGFFKRSLIESCVGTDMNPVKTASGSVYFDPALRGNPNRKYIMAIDPASEVDNFSITIVELHEDHRRLVYCWTTTRKDHIEKVEKGLTKENNFYSYCGRKIRELMVCFNVVHIAIDSQGGGYSISEALHDSNQLEPGEVPIWPIVDPEKPQPSDDQQGLHILELCNFAKYDWYSEANHGLRKDLEDKLLLFPRFDPVTIGISIEQDKVNNRLYDTLEDCVMEIEELKNELSLIEITNSTNGRERWDTPEVKIGVGKKQRMRKDRYSSLLMANMAARSINFFVTEPVYNAYGGFAKYDSGSKKSKDGATFTGPLWFTQQMNNVY